MKLWSPILFGSALALVLCAGTDARASFIPWSYNWSPGSASVAATTGSGRIFTSNELFGHAEGSTNLVVTDLRTASTAPRDHPDVFTNAPFSATLTIVDGLNGLHGTASFAGVFNGTISANSANVDFKLTSTRTVAVVLGKDVFNVTFGRYSPPGPPSAVNTGSIASFVSVKDPPQNAPEPSTALLACLGGSFLGLASWRRWARGKLSSLAAA
jgi:hypothetical protein